MRRRTEAAAYGFMAVALLAAGGAVAVRAAGSTNANCPWVGSAATPDQRADMVIAQMTLDDEIAMVHGVPGSPYVGHVPGNPALCIPAINLEDGPAGVADGMTGVTQLPAPVAAAASWDVGLMGRYGATIGAQERGKGAVVALAPTINIVRDPRWGRAFETFGEDPYLTASMAVADITGIQRQNVLAQVKHVAVYNQETFRNTPQDNAIVDGRTEKEIYLPAFAASVKLGRAASAMCAYSTVNGTYACQNTFLLKTVLKDGLGFAGFVTSDWSATHSTVASANAGLDMEMPGDSHFGAALKSAVQAGSVPKARLDDMVHRILRELFDYGLFDHAPTGSPGATVTSPAHAAVARDAATQGAVLLKNSGALPLDTNVVHSIAVIGRGGGAQAMTAGGGSAAVKAPYVVTPLSAIAARAGSGVTVQYADGSSASAAADLARGCDGAVVFADKFEKESADLSDINLSADQNALISQVAAANSRTVVVLNTGSAVTMPWLADVDAVVESWYPGQEDGTALAALLFGDANPSGHLPVTFPVDLSQVPAHTVAQWPGSNGRVNYSEGLQVGYRWYDAQGLQPLFPFGFGLSYTTFSYHDLVVTPLPSSRATVSVQVTNTGTRTGAAVPQIYVGQPAATGEPPKILAGFKKVMLDPGETSTVTFNVGTSSFRHWDRGTHSWVVSPGDYTIYAGSSSRDLPLSDVMTLP